MSFTTTLTSDSNELEKADMVIEFDGNSVRTTVIKLTDPVKPYSPSNAFEVSPTVLDSWERLVKMIASLRSLSRSDSPTGGWPSDLPQTPDNLIPYVIEEAYEVFDTLMAAERKEKENKENLNQYHTTLQEEMTQNSQGQPVILIRDLISQLLWYMARSSDDVMRLLAGVKARVFEPNQKWINGTLRLVTILTVDTPTIHGSIDLATNQQPPACLKPDLMIQSHEIFMGRQPSQSAALLEQLQQMVYQAASASLRNLKSPNAAPPDINTGIVQGIIQLFQDAINIDFIQPGTVWDSGYLQVQLGFEFIPEPLSTPQQDISNASPVTIHYSFDTANDVIDVELQPTFLLQESSSIFEVPIRLTDKNILERYSRLVVEQKLMNFLEENPRETIDFGALSGPEFDAIDLGSSSSIVKAATPQFIHQLVQCACEVVDRIENQFESPIAPTWHKPYFSLLQPEILVGDLTVNVLWHIIRSGYKIMQLVGGINANILQSGGHWQKGTVRLLAALKVHSGENVWEIDVSTNQILQKNHWMLEADTIIHSHESRFCQDPIEVDILVQQMRSQLQTTSSELEIWLQGTSVDLQLLTQQHNSGYKRFSPSWQPGSIQLGIGLEFLAHTREV